MSHTRRLCSEFGCGPSGRYAAAGEGQVASELRPQSPGGDRGSVVSDMTLCRALGRGVVCCGGQNWGGGMVHGKGPQRSLQMPPEAELPEPQGSAGEPRTVPGDRAAEATRLSRLQPSSLLSPRGQSVLRTSVACGRGTGSERWAAGAPSGCGSCPRGTLCAQALGESPLLGEGDRWHQEPHGAQANAGNYLTSFAK